MRKPHLAVLNEPQDQDKRTSFDLAYGFYAIMGGFRADVEEFSDNHSTAVLSPEAIITLAERGFFCDIEPSTIQDKSKANTLAKSLVILQVSWMVVQCIGRKLDGLPLTLLEIHTFVHAICAAMMYALWFKKPFSIGEATTLSLPSDLSHVIARMMLRSKYDFVRLQTQNTLNTEKARIHVTAANMQGWEHHKLPTNLIRLGVSVKAAQTIKPSTETQLQPYLYLHTPDGVTLSPESSTFWMSPFPQHVVEMPFTLKDRRAMFCAYINHLEPNENPFGSTHITTGGHISGRRVNIGPEIPLNPHASRKGIVENIYQSVLDLS